MNWFVGSGFNNIDLSVIRFENIFYIEFIAYPSEFFVTPEVHGTNFMSHVVLANSNVDINVICCFIFLMKDSGNDCVGYSLIFSSYTNNYFFLFRIGIWPQLFNEFWKVVTEILTIWVLHLWTKVLKISCWYLCIEIEISKKRSSLLSSMSSVIFFMFCIL